ncbi:MAG: hypothetical protein K2I03_08430 [Lachnospiraceae bacterium]|nr:hypothetical protein [Lachnospiraceae bacterium]
MLGIKRKINRKKTVSNVYKKQINEDRYGNETYDYPKEPSFQIKVMWLPVSSEVAVAEYGERVNEMMQACLFDDSEIIENDRVLIKGSFYNIISIKQYPSYRLLLAERVM